MFLRARLALALVRAKLARPFRWSREFVAIATEDPEHAIWVFGLRRAQIDGVADSELAARIRSHRGAGPAARGGARAD